MTGTDPIKLYTARVCPYAQRANIALKEAGVEYEAIEIDLQNKPDWYKNINPETKVPSINIRGKNIAESLVIIELVADLYPESGLLPADPIKRAEIRFFIEYYSKISSLSYKVLGALNDKQAVKAIYDDILKGFKRINELLLEQSTTGPYFLGTQFSLADVAVSPFIGRFQIIRDTYLQDFEIPREYERLLTWAEAVRDRPSFKASWPGEDFIRNGLKRHLKK